MKLDLLSQIKLAGLPDPVTEYRFDTKRKFRFDLCWPALLLAVEIEGQNSLNRHSGKWEYGRGRHNRPDGYERDVEKYNTATLLGWRIVRITTKMVRDGRALAIVEAAIQRFSGTGND